jgi:hypothetical protein
VFASGSLLRRRCLLPIEAPGQLRGCVRFSTPRDDMSQTLGRTPDPGGASSLRLGVRPDRAAPPPGFYLLTFITTGRIRARGHGIRIPSEKVSK